MLSQNFPTSLWPGQLTAPDASKCQVLLSVPDVDILSKEEANKIIAKTELVAVRQDFSGPSGRALLIFPGSKQPANWYGSSSASPLEDISSLEAEALARPATSFSIAGWRRLLSLLKRTLQMSLPVVVAGDSRQMLRSEETQTLVRFPHIKFEIRNSEIQGYVALLMDIPSMDALRHLIADFIKDATR